MCSLNSPENLSSVDEFKRIYRGNIPEPYQIKHIPQADIARLRELESDENEGFFIGRLPDEAGDDCLHVLYDEVETPSLSDAIGSEWGHGPSYCSTYVIINLSKRVLLRFEEVIKMSDLYSAYISDSYFYDEEDRMVSEVVENADCYDRGSELLMTNKLFRIGFYYFDHELNKVITELNVIKGETLPFAI